MKLIAECPECQHEWEVTEEETEQPARGPVTLIRCPKCGGEFKAGPMRAGGFIYFREEKQR